MRWNSYPPPPKNLFVRITTSICDLSNWNTDVTTQIAAKTLFLLHDSSHVCGSFIFCFISLFNHFKDPATEWLQPCLHIILYYQFYALKTCLALHVFFFLICRQKIAKFGKRWWHLPPTPASPTSCLPPIQPTNFQHFQICRLRNHADDLVSSDHRFDQSPRAKTGCGRNAGRASSDPPTSPKQGISTRATAH